MIFLDKTRIYIGKNQKTRLMNIAPLALELFQAGYILDDALFDAIAGTDNPIQTMIDILDQYRDEITTPLYPHWEERNFHSLGDLYVQYLSYFFTLSSDNVTNDGLFRILSQVNPTDFTMIYLASEDELQTKYYELTDSKIPLNQFQITMICDIIGEMPLVNTSQFAINENKVVVASQYRNSPTSLFDTFDFSPTDVLRYFAYNTNPEYIALPSTTKFNSQPRSIRRDVFEWLNNSFDVDFLCEALSYNRKLWKRFSNRFHPHDYPEFEKVWTAFHVVIHNTNADKVASETISYMYQKRMVDISKSGRLLYRSFNSRLEMAIERENVSYVFNLLSTRPNLLARRIVELTNKFGERAVDEFVKQLDAIENRVLFSLVKLNPYQTKKVYDVKGQIFVKTVEQDSDNIALLRNSVRQYLADQYAKYDKVIVSPSIARYAMPFSRHDVNTSEITRLSEIAVPEQHLQFYVHWKEVTQRVDIDLSIIAFDQFWNVVDYCDYTQQVRNGMKHSGDYTRGPATEYVKIDLSRVSSKARYIVPVVFGYNNVPFNTLKTVEFGWIATDNHEFNMGDVAVRMNIGGDYVFNIPLVYSTNGQVTWLDYGLNSGRAVQSVRSNHSLVGDIADGSMQAGCVSVLEFARMLGRVEVGDYLPRDGELYISEIPYPNDPNVVSYSEIATLL